MFAGIALALSELPLEFIETHGLQRRVCDRGGELEVQFLLRDAERVLPVWWNGQLHIVRWGNRRGQSRFLPLTTWTWLATLENGGWGDREAESVVIPATLGLDLGIGYRVREGIRGVLVRDEAERPVVFVLCEQASPYYGVMTRSPWMPAVLIGPRI